MSLSIKCLQYHCQDDRATVAASFSIFLPESLCDMRPQALWTADPIESLVSSGNISISRCDVVGLLLFACYCLWICRCFGGGIGADRPEIQCAATASPCS